LSTISRFAYPQPLATSTAPRPPSTAVLPNNVRHFDMAIAPFIAVIQHGRPLARGRTFGPWRRVSASNDPFGPIVQPAPLHSARALPGPGPRGRPETIRTIRVGDRIPAPESGPRRTNASSVLIIMQQSLRPLQPGRLGAPPRGPRRACRPARPWSDQTGGPGRFTLRPPSCPRRRPANGRPRRSP